MEIPEILQTVIDKLSEDALSERQQVLLKLLESAKWLSEQFIKAE